MSKVDVIALLERSERHMDGVSESDLAHFASLVLEEAAKACEGVHNAESIMNEGEFWTGICALYVRGLKPAQS